jgi:methyl-accepting chemotaxis protein
MNPIVTFALLVIFGLVPFGYLVVRTLYKGTITYGTAFTTFVASMGVGIIAFCVGNLGFKTLWWAIPVSLIWLVSSNFVVKVIVSRPIKELTRLLHEVAAGNLNLSVNTNIKSKKNEIGEIGRSIELLISELRQVTQNIHDCAQNVQIMSETLNATAVELSQGSANQASVVEELSSSMEEIASNINQNSDHASATKVIATGSANEVRNTSGSMIEALESMNKISEKISIISDIAFQTNILALNAAVEAARAGEHGRGFAVVAAEVRKLAENSRKAADDIISLSNNGQDLSTKARHALESIVPNIEKTAQLVEEIAATNIEQNSQTNQINNAIQSLNDQTQQTAATSEELVSAAESLRDQSDNLSQSISFFKLN